MEAASASETLVNFWHTTWRNNPEDSHLHFYVDYGELKSIGKQLWYGSV
jgi:hypothetical protein